MPSEETTKTFAHSPVTASGAEGCRTPNLSIAKTGVNAKPCEFGGVRYGGDYEHLSNPVHAIPGHNPLGLRGQSRTENDIETEPIFPVSGRAKSRELRGKSEI